MIDERQQRAAAAVRAHIAHYEQKRDLVMLGAYAKGSDPRLDAALARIDRIEAFLRQDAREPARSARRSRQLEALV